LLVGSVGISLAALIIVTVASRSPGYAGESIEMGGVVLLLIGGLLALSRLGKAKVAAWALSILYLSLAFYTVVRWGVDLPTGILVLALALTMCTVLLSRRTAVVFAILTIAALVVVGTSQATGALKYDSSWMADRVTFGDPLGFAMLLAVMLIISWLNNKELDRSLARARDSEAQLTIERDQLEDRVARRTRQLETEHYERYTQLTRFAAFGRLTSGIIHELVTPLTTVALNLEQMRGHVSPETLERAVESTKRMERYVEAARKQLQQQSETSSFDVINEIRGSISFLSPWAKKFGAKVELRHDDEIVLVGNPIRFNQLVTNLVANAIEAYDGKKSAEPKRVIVDMKKAGDSAYLSVQDWGKGIAPHDIGRIFEPFYSTKSGDMGMGLGLALVKEIVEDGFGGSIKATSSKASGTLFLVQLPFTKEPRAAKAA
jgi:signal transduction histidine kinase